MSEIKKNKGRKSFKTPTNKKNILFLDSGIGGLHILKECVKLSPEHSYIYVADTINAPYGNKRKNELLKIADKLVCELNKEFNPDIIVLACNSLTVNCIDFLRNKYKKTFVGIEPALKQARLNGGDTIIFATQATLKSYHKLNKKCSQQLKKEYRKQNLRYYNKDKVHKVFIPDLPLIIDKNCNNLEVLNPILVKEFDNLEYKKVNNLVLGCTHYIAIKPQLKQVLKDVQIFDGAIPVANRLQTLLKEEIKKEINEINSNSELDNILDNVADNNINKADNNIENSVEEEKNIVEAEKIIVETDKDIVEADKDIVETDKDIVEANKDIVKMDKEIVETDKGIKRTVKTENASKKSSRKLSKKFKISQVKFISLDGNPSKKSLLKEYFNKIL